MTDYTVRVRTLGAHSDAPVLSFSVVRFDRNSATFDPEVFTATVDLGDCEKYGYKIRGTDLSSLAELEKLTKLGTPSGSLWECLAEFLSWLEWKSDDVIWSATPYGTEDVAKLRDAFHRSAPLECPWRRQDELSYATLRTIMRNIELPLLVEQFDVPDDPATTASLEAARWLHTYFSKKGA